jgi:putative phosphoribosyl transferase
MPHPTWIESAVPQELLAKQDSAHALVLIAHPDEASRKHPGHGFVADVLQANGLGVLPVSLQAPGDDATGGAAQGRLQDRLRLRSVLAWVVAQPATRGRPVALIGVDGAVPACAALAHRANPLSPRPLVLFDGRPDPVAIALARLQVPTLYVVGKCDARLLARHRAALRKVPASHGVEILPRETWPAVAPGAFEALARAALSWFARTLPSPACDAGRSRSAAEQPRGHGSALVCPTGDDAPDR